MIGALDGPDEALERLMAGNRRYVTGKLDLYGHDLAQLRKDTENEQRPFANILACDDSRVPVELIFDQGIGQLFVTRIAGNIVTAEVMASLEFGAAVLGTKVILVMGHSRCGAVKATIEGNAVLGEISALFPHIQPAIERAGTDWLAAVRANAEIQADLLRKSSPLLRGMIAEKKLKVVAGVYDLLSGKVSLI